ncbi:MAG: conjugative transposon protein TraN [Rikenellaceae bacterium]
MSAIKEIAANMGNTVGSAIIFPSSVTYVDLGSQSLIAGKAQGAENVLRVKASVRGFEEETNLSVITDDGSFYTFNVKYSDEPSILNIDMVTYNLRSTKSELKLEELKGERPSQIEMIMEAIHYGNLHRIRAVGSRSFGVQYSLKSIYIHNNVLYLHVELANSSAIAFDIDFISMKIADRKVAKRTAIQEQIIKPIRIYNDITQVAGGTSERTIFAIEKITYPNSKHLEIVINERRGGRHQKICISNREILKAETINKLKIK